MGDYTAARRNKDLRQRRKAAGLVDVRLWIRPDQVTVAKQLEDDALLSVMEACEGKSQTGTRINHLSRKDCCIAFLVSTEVTRNADMKEFDGILKVVESARCFWSCTNDAMDDLMQKGILTRVPVPYPEGSSPLVIAVFTATLQASSSWHEFRKKFLETADEGGVTYKNTLCIEVKNIRCIEKFGFSPCS